MNEILTLAQEIIQNLNIEAELTIDNLIDSQFYCVVFSIMFPALIDQIKQIEESDLQEEDKISQLIQFLSTDILSMDLSHIEGAKIVVGDIQHLLNLIQLLYELSKLSGISNNEDNSGDEKEDQPQSNQSTLQKSQEAEPEVVQQSPDSENHGKRRNTITGVENEFSSSQNQDSNNLQKQFQSSQVDNEEQEMDEEKVAQLLQEFTEKNPEIMKVAQEGGISPEQLLQLMMEAQNENSDRNQQSDEKQELQINDFQNLEESEDTNNKNNRLFVEESENQKISAQKQEIEEFQIIQEQSANKEEQQDDKVREEPNEEKQNLEEIIDGNILTANKENSSDQQSQEQQEISLHDDELTNTYLISNKQQQQQQPQEKKKKKVLQKQKGSELKQTNKKGTNKIRKGYKKKQSPIVKQNISQNRSTVNQSIKNSSIISKKSQIKSDLSISQQVNKLPQGYYEVLGKSINKIKTSLTNMRDVQIPEDDPLTRDKLIKQRNEYKHLLKQFLESHKIAQNKQVNERKKQENLQKKLKSLNTKNIKFDKSLQNEQRSLYYKLRDQKVNYLRKMLFQIYKNYTKKSHRMVFEQEKNKAISTKKKYIQQREVRNNQTQNALDSISNSYSDKIAILKEKLEAQSKEKHLVEIAQREISSKIEKEIKREYEKQLQEMKNTWNCEREKFDLSLRGDGFLENEIMKLYKKYV